MEASKSRLLAQRPLSCEPLPYPTVLAPKSSSEIQLREQGCASYSLYKDPDPSFLQDFDPTQIPNTDPDSEDQNAAFCRKNSGIVFDFCIILNTKGYVHLMR
jgi:hypothetical protein